MTTHKNYFINSRSLTSYNPLEIKLAVNKEKNYLFDLSYLDVLEVSGEKATEFLQGQLTCDLKNLSDIQMVQGIQCNLKGRILALLDVVLWDGVKLIVPGDLSEATQSSLAKTAQLSRVSINKNEELRLMGFYLQNTKDLLPDVSFFPEMKHGQTYNEALCYYHLGNGFYIFIVKKEQSDKLINKFISQEQFLGSFCWHGLRLHHEQFDIYPESRGLFLPHRLGLHETSLISFNKGCYKGQEIIARTHYKATIKHQLKLFTIQTEAAIFSGQKLLNTTGDSELGELVDYSPLAEKHSYLIAVSILKESPTTVRLQGSEQLITMIELESNTMEK